MERLTATAAAMRIGVFELETSPLERIDKVNFCALQVKEALEVDKDLHPIAFKNLVPFAFHSFQIEVVLQTGTTTPHDSNPQASSFLSLLLDRLLDLFSS